MPRLEILGILDQIGKTVSRFPIKLEAFGLRNRKGSFVGSWNKSHFENPTGSSSVSVVASIGENPSENMTDNSRRTNRSEIDNFGV